MFHGKDGCEAEKESSFYFSLLLDFVIRHFECAPNPCEQDVNMFFNEGVAQTGIKPKVPDMARSQTLDKILLTARKATIETQRLRKELDKSQATLKSRLSRGETLTKECIDSAEELCRAWRPPEKTG